MPESVNFNLLIVCSISCNITVSVSDDFAKEAKRLAKKYPSFKQDYKEFLESIKNNPLQGDEITKNILSEKSSVTSSTLERNSSVVLFSALMTVCALVPLTMATMHPFLQVTPFLLLLSSFFAKRLKRMQKSDFLQAN